MPPNNVREIPTGESLREPTQRQPLRAHLARRAAPAGRRNALVRPLDRVVPDPITVDVAVVARARVVMQQMLLRCVVDPLDAGALEAAYDMQQMLSADLAAAHRRLRLALSCD